jgi:hypothetical protein
LAVEVAFDAPAYAAHGRPDARTSESAHQYFGEHVPIWGVVHHGSANCSNRGSYRSTNATVECGFPKDVGGVGVLAEHVIEGKLLFFWCLGHNRLACFRNCGFFILLRKGKNMPKLLGEWWVTPDGDIFCDGDNDVLTPHHSDVICAHLLEELLWQLETKLPALDISGAMQAGDGELVADSSMFVEHMHNRVDQLQSDGKLTAAEADDIWVYIAERIKWPIEKIELVTGRDNQEACNMYGIKELGWVRQHDRMAQFWMLTIDKLRMWLDNLPEDFVDDELGDIPPHTSFNIEVVKTGKMFLNVPYGVLSRCRQSLLPLSRYRRLDGEMVVD